jgi:cytochrome P450
MSTTKAALFQLQHNSSHNTTAAMISLMNAWTSDTAFFNTFPSAAILLTVIVTLVATVYTYFSIKYRYWKSRGISGPEPSIPFGNILRPKGKGWHHLDVERHAKYGKVYGVYQGTNPVLVIADSELLKDVLVRDFTSFADRNTSFHRIQKQSLITTKGKRWREQRTIMSPTFTSGKMKAMHHLIKSAISNLLDHMESRMMNGTAEFENKDLYGDLTLGVIAACAFATDTNAHQAKADNILMKQMKEFFNFNFRKIALASLIPDFVKEWIQFTASPAESLDFLINLSRTILEQRKQMGKNNHVDLLQLMLDAEMASEDGQVNKLTDEEIIANIILVLIAGYETTSSLLPYSTYSLAVNPEMQDRLRQEIEEAVAADGGEIKYDTIMHLKYLDAVINETLRKYTPVLRVERIATKDYEFKSLGIKIPKGNKVQIPIYAIHHQEDYYPEPQKFNPDRFMPENKDKLVPYTFLPFVTGPRNCIGARFALLEAKTALASVVLKYNLNPCPKTAIPLDETECKVLMAAKDVIISYSERK